MTRLWEWMQLRAWRLRPDTAVPEHIRELRCRHLGHRPVTDGDEWYCERCKDVLPEEKERRNG